MNPSTLAAILMIGLAIAALFGIGMAVLLKSLPMAAAIFMVGLWLLGCVSLLLFDGDSE